MGSYSSSQGHATNDRYIGFSVAVPNRAHKWVLKFLHFLGFWVLNFSSTGASGSFSVRHAVYAAGGLEILSQR